MYSVTKLKVSGKSVARRCLHNQRLRDYGILGKYCVYWLSAGNICLWWYGTIKRLIFVRCTLKNNNVSQTILLTCFCPCGIASPRSNLKGIHHLRCDCWSSSSMVLDPNEVEPNPRLQITGGKKRCRERSTLCSRRERREHRPYTHAAAASERDDVGFWREVGPPKIIDTSAVGTSHSRRSGRASKPPKRFQDDWPDVNDVS